MGCAAGRGRGRRQDHRPRHAAGRQARGHRRHPGERRVDHWRGDQPANDFPGRTQSLIDTVNEAGQTPGRRFFLGGYKHFFNDEEDSRYSLADFHATLANKKAVIFCAKRKEPHINSLKVKQLGGRVLQVPYGYLSNIQSKAKKFANSHNYQLLKFGAKNQTAINEIAKTTRNIINIFYSINKHLKSCIILYHCNMSPCI